MSPGRSGGEENSPSQRNVPSAEGKLSSSDLAPAALGLPSRLPSPHHSHLENLETPHITHASLVPCSPPAARWPTTPSSETGPPKSLQLLHPMQSFKYLFIGLFGLLRPKLSLLSSHL